MTEATGPISLGKAILDPEKGTLSRDGNLVDIRSKTFQLLCHLARNAGRVVAKDELMETVWPKVFVTEDSLTQCIRAARRAIGDDGQTIIRTVPRRGYIIVLPEPGAAQSEPPGRLTEPGSKSPEPLIAILPFRGNTTRRLMLNAFVEELGNAVARFRSVAVIAQVSANRFAGAEWDAVRAGHELGTDYCVTGDASEMAPPRLRLDLTEVATGRRVWDDTIGLGDEALLEEPARIATRIVGSLIGSVESAAGRRASQAPAANLKAYGHMVRGIALLRQHGNGVNEAARAELLTARLLDPDSGLVQGYLALSEGLIAFHAGTGLKGLKPARDLAAAACALAPDEARCHRILGIILSFMSEFAAAEARYHKAIELNPYDADTLAQYGYIRAVRGRPDEGLQLMERAFRLNPFHPEWYYGDRFTPLYMLGRFAEAADDLERLPHRGVRYSARLAAAYAMDGQEQRAILRLGDALEADPHLDLDAYSDRIEWERAEHRQLFKDGLQRARALWASADRS